MTGATQGLRGRVVIGEDAIVAGYAAAVFVDPVTGQPQWLGVWLPGETRRTVVPIHTASVDPEGRVVVPYPAAKVAAAPVLTAETISSKLAAQLHRYYGLAA
ncbi:MAG: hypothetical protein ACR2F6_04810 [Mycobacteriales bacterium]